MWKKLTLISIIIEQNKIMLHVFLQYIKLVFYIISLLAFN